jgi:UDP-N-acetylmuramate dehydrogenase
MLARLRQELAAIPGLRVSENVPLSGLTRFAIGGPARLLVDAASEQALASALHALRAAGLPSALIGGGTNLVASDDGFPGAVLRYTADRIEIQGGAVTAQAGASLEEVVDLTIQFGLRGLETMTGIPGWVGGAVYGNAGAYGHSMNEHIAWVRLFDGVKFREISGLECNFQYRESVFKTRKEWIVVAAGLRLATAEPAELKATADRIRAIRNQKYPPEMRCAGSIFKNLLLSDLPAALRPTIPESVVREGKVPSAYFLEHVGAKGMANDSIRVADYHANLIYNSGSGTARSVREMIETLRLRVRQNYGLVLEEEVQYL